MSKAHDLSRNRRAVGIILDVCASLGVDPSDLFSDYRAKPVVRARYMACYAIRKAIGLSFPDIARAVYRHENHSSSFTAYSRASRLCDPVSDDFDEAFAVEAERVIQTARVSAYNDIKQRFPTVVNTTSSN